MASSSSTRRRRGHVPKDSGISMGTTKPEPELDAAPTPPPASSSKEDFFICDRCEQPRAVYRRLPFPGTELFVCDYCFQPITMRDPRDASIVFEMKWCRQGNHEAPAIIFRDAENMSCYHCAKRCDSYPPGPLPELPLRVRPDSDSVSRKGKGAAAPGDGMVMQQNRDHQLHYAATQQQQHRREERPQIQYYAGSYKPRGHFENSSRPPKTLQIYHPQVRPPNMGNYTIKPHTSAPLQRLDANTESRARPKPQAQPKKPTVHSGPTTAAAKALPAQNPIRQAPAAPSWELKTLRAQEQKKKQQEHQDRIDALCRAHQPQPREPASQTTEQDEARADSDVLGPQETCPACGKHRPTYSELIEAYGFCFHCLRRHLVAAGELLKCPSCRRLQARQDFMTYNSDGLVVRRRTEVCMGCQWRHRNGAKKLGAVLCGTAGGLV
ncbi:hypothetical protein PG993_006762 [Apiospora rasikravindrae]|uniref:Uncharacterized protein n=1 Tax=Apiospora rasikravindrae TaxID=990691 RepID=A0ABR1T6K2_9PEZI